MKIRPISRNTKILNETEWRPANFVKFLEELENLSSCCATANHLALYRGHRDSKWLLDSTFARSAKKMIMDQLQCDPIPDHIKCSPEYNQILSGMFMLKFGQCTRPSAQLYEQEKMHNVDPWFEWMKRIQQYPEEDKGPIPGSFLVDWTQTPELAIFFANAERSPNQEGAVWIFDADMTGNIVHRDMKVDELLKLYEAAVSNNKPGGLPLLFCPHKQIAYQRAKNQDAVYVAQMDLRFTLAESWNLYRRVNRCEDLIFLKLILPADSIMECTTWLNARGITESFIYPDKSRIA